MPIQHRIPIVSQEFKVRIDILTLPVFMIEMYYHPSPTQPVLQTTTLPLKTTVILYQTFISGGFFF